MLDGPQASAPLGTHRPVPHWWVNALGAALVGLGLLLTWLLASAWPSVDLTGARGATQVPVCLVGWTSMAPPAPAASAPVMSLLPAGDLPGHCAAMSLDTSLLLLVMVAGALGSFVHIATSFADFVGNRRLARSWLWWYLLKPFVGMALAVVMYLVTRGGLLSANASADTLNLYGITAISALAGMFSKQATDKLSEVFNTLFRTSAQAGDQARQDGLDRPAPPAPPAVNAPAPTPPTPGPG